MPMFDVIKDIHSGSALVGITRRMMYSSRYLRREQDAKEACGLTRLGYSREIGRIWAKRR